MMRNLQRIKSIMLRYRICRRTVALVLSMTLLFLAIPMVIYAEIGNAISSTDNSGSNSAANTGGEAASGSSNETYAYDSPIYEVEELREENVKHFRLSDGTYIAAQYNYPVHYVDDDGIMQDIDNALSSASGGVFANNTSRIKFAKKITGNETLFTLKDGNKKLTFSLVGANKGTKGVITNYADDENDTELGKLTNLENIASSILYADILDGVDLEYVAQSLHIKENIIVKEKKDEYTYTFELKLNNMTAALQDNGDILVNDNDGNTVYIIPAPIAYDATGAYSTVGVATQTLEGKNGKYTLTVSADAEWMNAEERVYPITIDPAVYSPNASGVEDTFVGVNTGFVEDEPVYSYEPTVLGALPYLAIDSQMTAYWQMRNLPELPADTVISNIYLQIAYDSSSGRFMPYLKLNEVTSEWSESTLCGTNVSSVTTDDTVIDYATANREFRYVWDITELALKWYDDPTTNHGVAISRYYADRSDTLGLDVTVRLVSAGSETASQTNNTQFLPALTLNYVVNSGLEEYLSYASQSAGYAGTGYINHATGNLSFVIPTLSTTDSLMPYTPTLVYNSSLSGLDYIYPHADNAYTTAYTPYGFKLNIAETVLHKRYFIDGEPHYYYLYEDSDGTNHAFYEAEDNSGKYYDSDGLQMVMEIGTSSITITDSNDYVRSFNRLSFDERGDATEGFYLTSITDVYGNKVSFSFDEALRPTAVSLIPNRSTAIEMLKLYYSESGRLIAVHNETSDEAVVLRYSAFCDGEPEFSDDLFANYLRQLDYIVCTGNLTYQMIKSYRMGGGAASVSVAASSSYDYDEEGSLLRVTNNRVAQSLEYSWTDSRVSLISEYAGETLGQQLSLDYGVGYTEVRATGNDERLGTYDDILTRYIFDDRGRAVSIYSTSSNGSEIYGATVGEYETQENVKNNIKETTVIGGTQVNHILNGNFEARTGTGYDHWIVTGNVATPTISSYVTEGKSAAGFTPAAGEMAKIEQYVFLKEGEYTLSMPISTLNASDVEGYVSITSIVGSLAKEEQIPLQQVVTDIYAAVSHFATTFTVNDVINGGDMLCISIRFEAIEAVSYGEIIVVDEVMLENNIAASSFSYVNLGGFDNWGIDADGNLTADVSDFWQLENSEAEPTVVFADEHFGDALKLTAGVEGEQYVTQRVFEADVSSTSLSNVGRIYTLSGFAKAADALNTENAGFRLRADVAYYQGEGEPLVVIQHVFDFLESCDGWQFTAGTVDTRYIPTEDTDYSFELVKYIDIYCEYSGQANGFALFDNISFVECTDNSVQKYTYYENGLLKTTENRFYREYYEYNEDRNITRVANNRGEITDYVYYTSGNTDLVDYVVTYDFELTNGGGKDYPLNAVDPDSYITKTPKIVTSYEYDIYGQIVEVATRQVELNASGTLVNKTDTKYIITDYYYVTDEGSKIFGALSCETNSYDRTERYFYDETNGRLLATVNAQDETGVCYFYDDMGNLIFVLPATCTATSYIPIFDSEHIEYSYNERNLLSSVSTESTTYNFTYDAFGNQSDIKVGNSTLAEYTYAENNGKLQKIEYGNGFVVEYYYNTLELVEEIWYNYADGTRELAYSYEHTAYGQLYKLVDHIYDKTTVYKYDTNQRLTGVYEYEGEYEYGLTTSLNYNDRSELWTVHHYLIYNNGEVTDRVRMNYSYEYNSDGTLASEDYYDFITNGGISYTYDDYGRLLSSHSSMWLYGNISSRFTIHTEYSYREFSSAMTDSLVTGYSSTVNGGAPTTYAYEYDDRNNITKVTLGTDTEIRYYYDDLSQLVREDNELLGATYVYTYDNAGNILSKKTYALTADGVVPTTNIATNTYTYGNANWGDQLTAYNGSTITYDSIGNPLYYYNGFDFSWSGRRLVGASKNGISYSFTYNQDGIRTSKTVDGITTEYFLDGTQIIGERTGDNITVYIYDASGAPIGMKYHGASYAEDTWDVYWFEKNIQGDIVAVYDEVGTKLLSYTYDAWGNFSTSYYNLAISPSVVNNPFTYRGYYYDRGLGMYYLQSRYYDSNIGRFINADKYISTGTGILGCNMYAYCENNPVMFVDPTGEFISLIALLITTDPFAMAVTIHDTVQIASKNVNASVKNNDEVEINNSKALFTPWMQYGYSFYLNHFNEDTKDVITGTTAGVMFEWRVHNVMFLLGSITEEQKIKKQAENVNLGNTIFDDNHGAMSGVMGLLFGSLMPISFLIDYFN